MGTDPSQFPPNPVPQDFPLDNPGGASSEGSIPFAQPAVPVARGLVLPLIPAAVAASDINPLHLSGLTRGRALADLGLFIFLFAALLLLSDVVLSIIMFMQAPDSAPLELFPDSVDLAPEASSAAYGPELLYLMILRFLLAVGLMWIFLAWRQQPWASVGVTWRNAWMGISLALPTLMVAGGLVFGVMFTILLFTDAPFTQMERNRELMDEMLPAISLPAFAVLFAFVALWEELVFRGFLLTRLRRATGSWVVSVVLSSIVFALLHVFHQVPLVAIHMFLLSLVFSIATIVTRSLVPAVIAHFLWDFLTLVFLRLSAETPA